MSKISILLDQYYTKDDVAEQCFSKMSYIVGKKINIRNASFLEPSAGAGAFIRAIKKSNENAIVVATDIAPHCEDVTQKDFLEFDRYDYPELNASNPIITIGNPPFGKRSKLAINFFNISAGFSDVIAFIVPKQFEKWSVQKELSQEYALVHTETINPKSFLLDGKEATVRCVFQIWAKKSYGFEDHRIQEAPPTTHPDFILYQYNNTIQARKYFEYDWDFCIARQGFYDYSKNGQIEKKDANKCNYKIQYMFFKAKNETVLDRLRNMDYEELAKKNTTVPGFGKADVIQRYNELYGHREG